ncbi:MAG: NAD(P)/FAD-dependent oxidoreductase [Pseudomonadota bacterium]|nr:NAD(P)/FAD-dependent oxidoreductase [Pseudomonadota bacterium]
MERTQVIVVGAGPVGTVASIRLARMGIDVILLESLPTPAKDLRASTWHPPTLEMMSDLGVADFMIKNGLICPVYQYRDRNKEDIFSFDLSELSDVTKYPFRLQYEQFKFTRYLCELLSGEPNAKLRFSHQVIDLEQHDEKVIILAKHKGSIKRFEANYAISAEGANSILRKKLNIDFEGFTFPEKFVTLSTNYPLEKHYNNLSNVNYIADPEAWVLLLRTPDYWRVLVPAPADATDDFLVSDQFKDYIFNDITGGQETVASDHRVIYRIHQRVARSYRSERVLLAGDAAHLNNPLGGFGMNSGVHDAWNVSHQLDQIINHNADDVLLDLYEKQRQTVTRNFIQTQSIKNKYRIEQNNDEWLREDREQMRKLSKDAELRRKFLLDQALFTSLEDASKIKI